MFRKASCRDSAASKRQPLRLADSSRVDEQGAEPW